jgi:uncharacterized membrane protein YqaE (UPF0057 family)
MILLCLTPWHFFTKKKYKYVVVDLPYSHNIYNFLIKFQLHFLSKFIIKMPQYSTYDMIALLVSVLLPPLGVFMKRGLYSEFWINVILTFLGKIFKFHYFHI